MPHYSKSDTRQPPRWCGRRSQLTPTVMGPSALPTTAKSGLRASWCWGQHISSSISTADDDQGFDRHRAHLPAAIAGRSPVRPPFVCTLMMQTNAIPVVVRRRRQRRSRPSWSSTKGTVNTTCPGMTLGGVSVMCAVTSMPSASVNSGCAPVTVDLGSPIACAIWVVG